MRTAREFAEARVASLTEDECQALLVDMVEAYLCCDNETPFEGESGDWSDFPQIIAADTRPSIRDVLRAPCRVEINDPGIMEDILSAAEGDAAIEAHLAEAEELYGTEPRLTAGFEHGGWFVTCVESGRQWSVHDVNDEFGFEELP